MIDRRQSDRGQAFPIYIVMVAGLLFLAFAFFAVGKASATRNGAQGAADSAAIAAAQKAREDLGPTFLGALLLPGGLNDFFGNHYIENGGPCYQAQRFAAENNADKIGCTWRSQYLRDQVTVQVRTRNTVGKTVIPMTKTRKATATATAVVEFRCSVPRPEPSPSPDLGQGDGKDKDKGKDGEKDAPEPISLKCDGGRDIDIDPADPDAWSHLGKLLFAVHLIDD